METQYTADAYTPGLFWITNNNNATKPKAGIYLQLASSGSRILFGTSNNYGTGLTNTAMLINESGSVGIGTTSPERNLHVFKGESSGAASNSDSTLVLENSSHTYVQFLTPATSESGLLSPDSSAVIKSLPSPSFLNLQKHIFPLALTIRF